MKFEWMTRKLHIENDGKMEWSDAGKNAWLRSSEVGDPNQSIRDNQEKPNCTGEIELFCGFDGKLRVVCDKKNG